MKVVNSKNSMHTVMAHPGFGPVKIIQEGVKRLTPNELSKMTIADAYKCYANGLAITTA